jgi:hypothetical protein
MKSLSITILISIMSLGCAATVFASTTSGTIDPNNAGSHFAEFTQAPDGSGSESINFGVFSAEPSYNIRVDDGGLYGYAWSTDAGWIVMNCVSTTNGCSSDNGNFKVSIAADGTLSGYAWGQKTGWVNFGPFADAPQVKISSSGTFGGTTGSAGYAWSQVYGWIVFDCTNTNTCVTTDYVPAAYRTTTASSSGGGGHPILPSDQTAQTTTSTTPQTTTTPSNTQTTPPTSPTPITSQSTTPSETAPQPVASTQSTTSRTTAPPSSTASPTTEPSTPPTASATTPTTPAPTVSTVPATPSVSSALPMSFMQIVTAFLEKWWFLVLTVCALALGALMK